MKKTLTSISIGFDLRGCLPFVVRNTNSVDSTKLFFTKGSTLMLFCLTNKNEVYTSITRDETHFIDPYPGEFGTANIQSEIIDNRLLPEFAMIKVCNILHSQRNRLYL